jgi:hypothetical protein
VLNLADRSDGQHSATPISRGCGRFVAPATLALLAGRLSKDKADLAKLVATDPLTGLFNRGISPPGSRKKSPARRATARASPCWPSTSICSGGERSVRPRGR